MSLLHTYKTSNWKVLNKPNMKVRMQNNALWKEITVAQNYVAPQNYNIQCEILKIKVNWNQSRNYESGSVIQAFPVLQLSAIVLSTSMEDIQCPINGDWMTYSHPHQSSSANFVLSPQPIPRRTEWQALRYNCDRVDEIYQISKEFHFFKQYIYSYLKSHHLNTCTLPVSFKECLGPGY
jgi:hypothetical protein